MDDCKKNSIYCIAVCLIIIILDQASKYSVLAFLTQGNVVNIIPGINLVLTFNFGISFGLLSPNTQFGSYIIIALIIFCICAIFYFFIKTQSMLEKMMSAFIIGGAIGNLIDRILHGAVVDFIDLYYKNMHWPAFNFADAFITIGACVVILHNLLCDKC